MGLAVGGGDVRDSIAVVLKYPVPLLPATHTRNPPPLSLTVRIGVSTHASRKFANRHQSYEDLPLENALSYVECNQYSESYGQPANDHGTCQGGRCGRCCCRRRGYDMLQKGCQLDG